jgi:hypothetical protein
LDGGVIIEHFRLKVMHELGGRAKAMVVISSRLSAVKYKRAFDRYIQAKGYSGIRALVAFSGSVEDPGLLWTRNGSSLFTTQALTPLRSSSRTARTSLLILSPTFVRRRGSAFSGVRAASNRRCSLRTASLVGSRTQSNRRKTTKGNITSRYCGGRYGPRRRFAISQIFRAISL